MSLTDIINEAIDKISGTLFAGVVSTDGLGVEMVFAGGGPHLDLELAELELEHARRGRLCRLGPHRLRLCVRPDG